MSITTKIAVVVGSLRSGSYSRMTAKALIELAPANLDCEIIEIGTLPLYNQDLEDTPPQEWVEFRNQVRPAGGLLFVTPEFNRSVPGALKNAVDVGSRPYGHSVWNAKPGAVVSVSPGAIGGFGANHHLRQSLVFLNVPTMQQPEAYVGGASTLFDEQGKLINDDTRKFLQTFMERFAAWVERNAAT